MEKMAFWILIRLCQPTGLHGPTDGQIKGMDPLLQLSKNLAKTSVWHFLGIHMAVASASAVYW